MAILDGMGGGLNLLGGGDGSTTSGLVLGMLLSGRGGLHGNNGGGECGTERHVTQADLNAQTLGDIKASIPFNEAQVQLAVAGLAANLTSQANANTQYLASQAQAAAIQSCQNAALAARDTAAVDTNVDRQSTAIQVAIAENKRDLEVAIEKSKQDILSTMTSQRIAELEQRLTVAQLDNSENRAINREQVNSHNVTTTVNTNQQQAQLQSQRQDFMLNQLVSGFTQLARATNSNVIVGSAGAITGQTANPTNVMA